MKQHGGLWIALAVLLTATTLWFIFQMVREVYEKSYSEQHTSRMSAFGPQDVDG